MAGQWLVNQIADRDAAGLSLSDAEQTAKIALPRNNFISRIGFRIRATHATSIDLTGKKVQVIANGNAALFDVEWEDMRALAKFESGTVPEDAAAGTETFLDGVINFGRFPRDTKCILPAKIFKSLELRLTTDPNATPTAFDVSVWVEEYVSDDAPSGKLIKRTTISDDKAAGNSSALSFDLLTGNLIRAVIVHTDDVDNVGGEPLTVKVNGGVEIPFTMRFDQLREQNEQTYRFEDGSVHTAGTDEKWVRIDFDVLEDLAGVLDSSRMTQLKLHAKGASSGTSGNVKTILEELLAVA